MNTNDQSHYTNSLIYKIIIQIQTKLNRTSDSTSSDILITVP